MDVSFIGGGRWIRTTEGIASRFTVCPIWPLWNSPIFSCVGAGGRIRTPDLLITNVGRSAKASISGAFLSFRVGGSAVYEPAASIQYIRSCSRLGHGLGQQEQILVKHLNFVKAKGIGRKRTEHTVSLGRFYKLKICVAISKEKHIRACKSNYSMPYKNITYLLFNYFPLYISACTHMFLNRYSAGQDICTVRCICLT